MKERDMSRSEELFEKEAELREAAIGYANVPNISITPAMQANGITRRSLSNDARKALRWAAIGYADTANHLDDLEEEKP